jgi:hypothetical protein
MAQNHSAALDQEICNYKKSFLSNAFQKLNPVFRDFAEWHLDEKNKAIKHVPTYQGVNTWKVDEERMDANGRPRLRFVC